MIYNEKAYYSGYYSNVRVLGAIPALVFDTICGLLRETGIGEISNSTLCELLGITAPGLRKVIGKLIETGYIEKVSGLGAGNKTTYMVTEKGKQSCPFIVGKRETKFLKKGNEVSKKGKQSCPLNKELNKELKESGGDTRAYAITTPLSTTTTKEDFNMVDFDLFWSKYPDAAEFPEEEENCRRFWESGAISKEWKKKLVDQLAKGLKYRNRKHDNPIWYLRNYQGETARGELPFLRQGSAKFGKWIADAERDGKKVILMHYDDALAYCYAEDRELMESSGAKFIREYVY